MTESSIDIEEWLLRHGMNLFFITISFAAIAFGLNQTMDLLKRIGPLLTWLRSWVSTLLCILFIFAIMWLYLTSSKFIDNVYDTIGSFIYIGQKMLPKYDSNYKIALDTDNSFASFMKSFFVAVYPSSKNRDL